MESINGCSWALSKYFKPEESEILAKAYAEIEKVRPVTRHPANLRLLLLEVEKQPFLMGLMAHPEKYGTPYGSGVRENEGIDSKAAFRKLQAAGITHLVALDEFEFPIMSQRWADIGKENGKETKAHLFATQDMTPISDKSLEAICAIGKSAAKNNEGMVIYCGKGFGRSGLATVYTILKMQEEARMLIRDKKTVVIEDLMKNSVNVPFHVAAAIKKVRQMDPPKGLNLKNYNGRSSEEGISIETSEQIMTLARIFK